MSTCDWLAMLDCLQALHHFSRTMLPQGKSRVLTNSELEILFLVYFASEPCTPLFLSQRSGMKKEAVSRGLRRLFEMEWLQKTPNPEDERSYILLLTDAGRLILRQSYGPMLQPLYELRSKMGPEFAELFRLMHRANTLLSQP